jgi:4-amino-4-deoxy-L-arabinose transferase-like glycosyltransferase
MEYSKIKSAGVGSWRRDLIFIMVAVGVLFGFRLGSYPLANPDEGRYAEVPREMVERGDYVIPRLNGVLYFEKPPMLYWLNAMSIRFLGTSEWYLRMWPALFALGGCLMTYTAGRKLFGRSAGLTGTVVLATSLLYYGLSRILILDMIVSSMIAVTLFAFILGVREPPGRTRRLWFYLLYTGAALATLTKGLIGFVLPGAVIFCWLLLTHQWRRLRPFYLVTGSLIFLAIALPWHVLAARANEDFFQFYIIHSHFDRFTSKVHGHQQPIWFFIPIALAGLFPWVCFLWPALRRKHLDPAFRVETRSPFRFMLIWAGFILFFFSISGSKLPPYILPMLPPLALLIGVFLARIWEDRLFDGIKVGLRVYLGVCILLLIGAAIAYFDRPTEVQKAVLIPAILSGVLFAASMIGVIVCSRGKRTRMALRLILLTAVGFYFCLTFIIPIVQRPSTRDLAHLFRDEYPEGTPVYCYYDYFYDFSYYSATLTGTVESLGELEFGSRREDQAGRFIDESTFRQIWSSPERIVCIVRERSYPALFGDETFRYRLVAETDEYRLIDNQFDSAGERDNSQTK